MANPTLIINNGYNGAPSVLPIYPTVNEDGLDLDALTQENKQLKIQLQCETELRKQAESHIEELKEENKKLINLLDKKRKPRTAKKEECEYSEFKSDGKRKAQATDGIRSYDDFIKIQDYLLSTGDNGLRDWMMWTIGVSFGLRISDIFNLKYKYFLKNDFSFRERMIVVEKKTSKLNNVLITESVKMALTKYLDDIGWKINLEDYVFMSKKTKDKLTERHGWKILSNVGKALELPINIGSHTMRKSFANIAACVDKTSIDMNTITKVQGLLNHSDQRVTLKYLGSFQEMYDNARVAVSDFILGKTNVKTLTPGASCTLDEVMNKLDALETQIRNKE